MADTRVCKNSGLQFVRLFVLGGGGDDESHIFLDQFGMLDREANTLILEAAFYRIQKHSAGRSRKYRGYILNEHYLPATVLQISRIIKLSRPETFGVLKVLKKYNLIEKVPMPDFEAMTDESESEPPVAGEKDQPRKGTKGTKRKKSKPKETEADEAVGAAGGRAPAESTAAGSKMTRRQFDKHYSAKARVFADHVYTRIWGIPAIPDADSLTLRQELGNFAAAWTKVEGSKLSEEAKVKLWDRMLTEADKQHKNRQRKIGRNHGAIWRTVFNSAFGKLKSGL